MEPSGSIALVTGGSRGLGKDMIKRLVGRGTDVISTYQSNESAAEAVAAEILVDATNLGVPSAASRVMHNRNDHSVP